MTVAALYVAHGGVYYGLPGVEPWGLPERDAREYAGPHPVVAHPPCQRWVNMAGLNFIRYTREKGKPQPHLRPGNDGGCFARALESVRRWGGVLEHPAGSHAWSTFALVRPSRGQWVHCADTTSEAGDLWVCEVCQSAYGHRARKRTWLLYCGQNQPPDLNWEEIPGEAQIGWFDRNRPTVGKKEADATPLPFREVLLSLARGHFLHKPNGGRE